VKQSAGAGSVTINSYQGALYGSVPVAPRTVLSGALIGGFDSYSTKRGGDFTAVPSASSSHSGASVGFDGAISHDFFVHNLLVAPSVALTYANVSQASFSETSNGALALGVSPRDVGSLRTHVDVSFSGTGLGASSQIVPEVHIGWRHEYLDDSAIADVHFLQGNGGTFSQTSVTLGRDAAEYGGSLKFKVGSPIRGTQAAIFVSYDGAATSRGTENSFEAAFKLTW
jgi:outer membrane autotransporter protein